MSEINETGRAPGQNDGAEENFAQVNEPAAETVTQTNQPAPETGKKGKKKRFKEGRRIKTLPPMNAVACFIMRDRIGSSNLFRDSVDVAALEKYVRKKREAGLKGFGVLHVLLAAYVRAVALRPGINRFIRGQRIYARNNVEIIMAIKKTLELDAMETMVKLDLQPNATADEIYEKFTKLVEDNRAVADGDVSSFDKAARVFNFIPRFLLRFAISVIRTMDYYGLLPRGLTKLSPFHGSLVITSMGSLGIPPIYHHLYDFGNVPAFVAYGKKRPQLVLRRDGTVEERKFIDFTVTTDERICDGQYYASAFKLFKDILAHPERLDDPVTVVNDIR